MVGRVGRKRPQADDEVSPDSNLSKIAIGGGALVAVVLAVVITLFVLGKKGSVLDRIAGGFDYVASNVTTAAEANGPFAFRRVDIDTTKPQIAAMALDLGACAVSSAAIRWSWTASGGPPDAYRLFTAAGSLLAALPQAELQVARLGCWKIRPVGGERTLSSHG